MKAFLIITLCIPATLITALAACNLWETDPWNISAPSDQALIDRFKEHRAAFENVVNLIASDDNAEGWLYNNTLANAPMPGDKQKRRRFDQLVKEIGFGDNVTRDPDRSISFTVVTAWPSGFGLGWDKGYIFKPTFMFTQDKVLKSLDHARECKPGSYYRRIDRDWYLFYFVGER